MNNILLVVLLVYCLCFPFLLLFVLKTYHEHYVLPRLKKLGKVRRRPMTSFKELNHASEGNGKATLSKVFQEPDPTKLKDILDELNRAY